MDKYNKKRNIKLNDIFNKKNKEMKDIRKDIGYFNEKPKIELIYDDDNNDLLNITESPDNIYEPSFWSDLKEKVNQDYIQEAYLNAADSELCPSTNKDQCAGVWDNATELSLNTNNYLCNHMKQGTKERAYIYDLPEGQLIYLCPFCNMHLAEKIMGQIALETFIK